MPVSTPLRPILQAASTIVRDSFGTVPGILRISSERNGLPVEQPRSAVEADSNKGRTSLEEESKRTRTTLEGESKNSVWSIS